MSADPQRAGEAGCCVLCGARSIFCLCGRCRREWAPDGVLPGWLRELRRPAVAATSAGRRNRERVRRGPVANQRGQRGGARYAAGVELVSLDALTSGQGLERL